MHFELNTYQDRKYLMLGISSVPWNWLKQSNTTHYLSAQLIVTQLKWHFFKSFDFKLSEKSFRYIIIINNEQENIQEVLHSLVEEHYHQGLFPLISFKENLWQRLIQRRHWLMSILEIVIPTVLFMFLLILRAEGKKNFLTIIILS